ncbi:hypothetical protein [Cardiobacterium hominis]
MREEFVTINIIKWLKNYNWDIVCYDFPQSGTGVMIHPNTIKKDSKNKGGIIPDIIAVKDIYAIFFENKDRFAISDFEKIHRIKNSFDFSDGLCGLIGKERIFNIRYGIGLPKVDKYINQSKKHVQKIDFLVSVHDSGKVCVEYDATAIFGN